MKKIVTLAVLGLGTSFAIGCEPGAGKCDAGNCSDAASTTGGTDLGTTTGVDTGSTTGGASFGAIELEDDPNNTTLADCTATTKSPGADIDGLILFDSSGTRLANGSGCSLKAKSPSPCPRNDYTDATLAEGAPDSDGSEGNWVSLNGGALFCAFEGKQVEKGQGQKIEIHEVGPQVEKTNVSLCKDTAGGACQFKQNQANGVSTIIVDQLL